MRNWCEISVMRSPSLAPERQGALVFTLRVEDKVHAPAGGGLKQYVTEVPRYINPNKHDNKREKEFSDFYSRYF
jgi:hypothetical protein